MPKQTFFNLPDEKREHILDVAVLEFAEKGYRSASISSIVAAAGIAKGSFYQYFEDKDDLYIHIVSTMIADAKIETYKREMKRLDDLSLTGYLRLVFRLQTEEFIAKPQILRISMDLMGNTGLPVYKKIMDKYRGMVDGYFLPYIEYETERGELDPKVNALMLNYMLISMGQYLMYIMGGKRAEAVSLETIEAMADDLEYILTHGIYKTANTEQSTP